jgi:hypothetical protein
MHLDHVFLIVARDSAYRRACCSMNCAVASIVLLFKPGKDLVITQQENNENAWVVGTPHGKFDVYRVNVEVNAEPHVSELRFAPKETKR